MDINEKRQMMINDPVERLMLKMAVPTVISMLVTALYNMVDTFFVGSISTNATASVGVAFSIMAVIQAVGFFFGQGSGNFISRAMGRGDYESSGKMAATGVVSCFVFGIALMIAGMIYLTPLCKMLGATPKILHDTEDYMRYILIAAPFMMASMVLNNQLRFQGSAVYSMVGLCCGAGLNVALDPLFIFVFKMGVSGAALATAISQIVSFSVLIIGTMQKSNISIRLSKFTFSAKFASEIFKCGFPSLCRQGLISASQICLNHVAGNYGEPAIAAMSITARCITIAFSVLIGIGQGFQPVCGFNYGAGRYDRVLKGFSFLMKITLCIMAFFGIVGFIFAPQIVPFFRDDPKVIKIGITALRYNCISIVFLPIVMNVSMIMQNLGKAGRATVLGSARGGLIFIPVLFIFSGLFGLLGLQLAQPVTDIISGLVAIPFVISITKELKSKINN